MRAVTLDINTLLRLGISSAWPGTPETVLFDDDACPTVGDDPAEWLISLVFIVQGYDSESGDSIAAPGGWQVYTPEQAKDLIPIWSAQDLEFHAATKIECSSDPDQYWIVSNSIFDVQHTFETCCGSPTIPSAARVFVQSNEDLTPGETYPCGAEAIFKWLAIKGTGSVANLKYTFQVKLTSADGLTEIEGDLVTDQPLAATTQLVKSWPDDFVGLVIGATTLVANDATPGVGEMRVGDFDGGTIDLTATVVDDDTEETVSSETRQFALPVTQCDDEGSGSFFF